MLLDEPVTRNFSLSEFVVSEVIGPSPHIVPKSVACTCANPYTNQLLSATDLRATLLRDWASTTCHPRECWPRCAMC
jgi:hypothetical protein